MNDRRSLPPIPFELVPLTPLPEVREAGWAEWDAAVAALDAQTPDGRARRLAEEIPA